MKNTINKIISELKKVDSLKEGLVSFFKESDKLNIVIQDSNIELKYIFNSIDTKLLETNDVVYTGTIANLSIDKFNPVKFTDAEGLRIEFEKTISNLHYLNRSDDDTYFKIDDYIDNNIIEWIELFKEFDVDYSFKIYVYQSYSILSKTLDEDYWESTHNVIADIEVEDCYTGEIDIDADIIIKGNSKAGVQYVYARYNDGEEYDMIKEHGTY